jgi:hypothetical protein
MSFHRDVSPDGLWHAGDVVRVFDGAFGDGVVLGFNSEGDALVQRPYAYASGVGTTGPTGLLGSERIVYYHSADGLRPALGRFAKVGESRRVV